MSRREPNNMKISHTPGPWIDDKTGKVSDAHYCTIAHCQSYGASIIPSGYVAPWHRYLANARLIACAPDLLTQLAEMTDLAERYGVGKDCDGNILAARELIARAKGESP